MALSLRSISISVLTIGLLFTIASILISEGTTSYNVPIDVGEKELFNSVNQSVAEEYSRVQNQSDKIYDITGSEILEGAFEGGSAVLQVIKTPFTVSHTIYKLMSEFAGILGIPTEIMVFFNAMILVTILWLMVYSIRRYREDV